ncbi:MULTISPECIES: urease subunit gamma [Acidianus]|uniref:urease n=1 Tax=Candidatus Acidianus copahuensis TaxID=1160895 RepID=A0A031LV64_9CREN|nr:MULTISPECIES: urease subunit gamma [Acidianus]EZQ12272.1 Urease subunit alpha [Candidatus Acidianus copahuensis]NON61588.1 urease subunit gamma [Acidianus sp. RZ1]
MYLSPREQEKLLISWAAELAKRRKSKGLKLNFEEAYAILIDYILESAREGKTMKEIITGAQTVLSEEDVMDGVPDLIDIVQVEATFPDGTKLVTIRKPIKSSKTLDTFVVKDEEVDLGGDDKGEEEIEVDNIGDRPVQVGSHFHFFEVNRTLRFNREKAFGKRLDIPAGTSIRFEPGEKKVVKLRNIGGNRRVTGLNGLTEGSLNHNKEQAIRRAKERDFS